LRLGRKLTRTPGVNTRLDTQDKVIISLRRQLLAVQKENKERRKQMKELAELINTYIYEDPA